MGNITSYNPFAFLFKPEPTEQDLLKAEEKGMIVHICVQENELKRSKEQLSYIQHKLQYWKERD